MTHDPTTLSSNDLRALDDATLKALRKPVAVTVAHDPVAMLLPAEVFRRLLRERDILRRLAVGDLEFAAQEGHPLDEVIEDCELLLEEN
jgi:hypothetical protein